MTRQSADTHAALEACTAWHIPPQPHRVELEGWAPPLGPIRVLEHTCDRCPGYAYSYEWGTLGGAYCIRRLDRSAHVHGGRVLQTPPLRRVEAEPLWDAVRAGTLY